MKIARWVAIILFLLGLITITNGGITDQNISTTDQLSLKYRYSQYCLQGYRDQHHIDVLLPEFGKECDNNTEFRGNIEDPDLYVLAGTRYIAGASPTSINWETQPLIKYILGLSVMLFGQAVYAQYFISLLILIILYLASRRFLNLYLSLLPSILLTFDPLFRDQLLHPYLDLSVTMFVLLWFLYLTSKKREALWWVGGIILGGLSLSKSFSLGIVAAVLGGIYFALDTKNYSWWLGYLKILIISITTYLLGYVMFFVNDHNLTDFVILHINILKLYKSYVPEYPKGEIFRIIFTGQWRTWWGDKGLIESPFWSPLWGLSLLSSTLLIIFSFMRKNKDLLIHFIWMIIFFVFISLRLVFPRYLLPVLPSLYLLLTVSLVSIYQFAKIVFDGRKH